MWRLLWAEARRDRRQLGIWLVGIALVVAGSAGAVSSEFSSEQARAGLLAVALATPSLLALRGLPNGSGLGALIFFQIFAFVAVVVGLLNTFLATRHGRADEERGRRELVAAAPLRRTAPVTATLIHGTVLNAVVAAVAAGALIVNGLDAVGAAVTGLAVGVTGFVCLGFGLLVNQLTPTSRAANGIGAAFVGFAYAARAAGDALGSPDLANLSLRSAWPSWISPIGWGEQTRAFSDNRLWPLLPGLGLGAATAAAALVIQSRRDIGASLLPERWGPAASGALRGNLALSWRLQWPSLVGWIVAGALLGLLTGGLAAAVADATLGNPQITDVLQSLAPGGGGDITGIFIAALIGLVVILAAAAGMQGVLRLRDEEEEGHAELVLATAVRRSTWLLDAVIVAVVSVLLVLAAVGLTASLSFLLNGDRSHARAAVSQAAAGVPAALVFVGLVALLVTVLPRFAVVFGWGLFGVAVAIGLLGALLRLPAAVLDLSPFSHIPTVPIESWTSTLLLLALTVALTALAVVAVRRRELVI
jgi:ABC-2 type transport system permease protein